jgi:hypothetical protein
MILEEIAIGEDKESKIKAIQDNLGQQAILNDGHENWCHCMILKSGYDSQVYQVRIGDGRGERQLHYHDLNKLIILRSHSKYPLPKI